MKLKSAVLATLLGGLTIFVWGALSHMIPPEPVTTLSDTKAIDEFAAKHTPQNGAYMDPRGYMVIVGFRPDKSDKAVDMGPQLGIEFATNLVQAFLLFLVLGRIERTTVLGYGKFAALLGVMAWIAIEVSYWGWYAFPPPLVLMGLLDASVGYFLAGCLVGWQVRK
ncbi:MAG: hypothetical protein FJW36_10565 [Acidobacteria bacterium]|nr:hypothetical protein [Acidobacteriota bacterium]